MRLRQLLSGPDNFYKFHNNGETNNDHNGEFHQLHIQQLHDFDHSNELDGDDKETLQWRCQENFDGVCELDMTQNVGKTPSLD